MADGEDIELPRAIALAWGVAAHPQRGPKRELSIERIVEAAVEIADESGLASVSMASVASRLGFTPMSLYRYVSAKDDLVTLMGELGLGLPPESIAEAGGWRERLRAGVDAQLGRFREHPWLLDLPIVGYPVTPHSLAWLDTALAAFAGMDLPEGDKLAIVLAVTGLTRWEGLIARGYAAATAEGRRPEDLDVQGAAVLAQFVTPAEFPALFDAMSAGVFDPAAADDDATGFRFGLDRLLDGIAQYLAKAPTERPTSSGPSPDPEEVERDRDVRQAAKAVREAEKALRAARKVEREARARARERHRRG